MVFLRYLCSEVQFSWSWLVWLPSSITVVFDSFLSAEGSWFLRRKSESQQTPMNDTNIHIVLSRLPTRRKDFNLFFNPEGTAGLKWKNCRAWFLHWRASPQTPIKDSKFDLNFLKIHKFDSLSSITTLSDIFCICKGVLVSRNCRFRIKIFKYFFQPRKSGWIKIEKL